MTETIKPPAHLSKKAAAYFKRFVAEYDCEDSDIEVLIRICESGDRADQCAAALKKHGSLLSTDRFGCERAHPLVAVERAARAAVIDGIKALGVLKDEKPADRYSNKVF